MEEEHQGDLVHRQAAQENVGPAILPNVRFGYPPEFPAAQAAQGPYYYSRQGKSNDRISRNAPTNEPVSIDQVTESMEQCSLSEITLSQKVTVKREVQNDWNYRSALAAFRGAGRSAESSSNAAANPNAPENTPNSADNQGNTNNVQMPAGEVNTLGSVVANLHAAAENADMIQTAAKVLEGYCLGGLNHDERIGIAIRHLFIFAMDYRYYKTMANLAMLLDSRIYIFAERKSFMDYFREWTAQEVEIRTFLSSIPGISLKLRFLMALCAHLTAKFHENTENAKFFQEVVFTLMNDLLICKSLGNIRAIVHVLTEYGDILFQRDKTAVLAIVNTLQAISQQTNQINVVKQLVTDLLAAKAQWCTQSVPSEEATNGRSDKKRSALLLYNNVVLLS
ncbi:hypothetical protein TTRE_0000941901 [Trichuris trichiura]|uniref:Uncharacterized protein n=1 Tax=Trichuris trichiura TaxID=36087 RepID=A0A077ZMN4_TRITR|nr:hypothetical protein TTRE_0000941901 [Trichuris trichiura]